MRERFDYVVVGGGSSGCILAARLSEDPSVRVLLLEHGDSAEEHEEALRVDQYKDAFVHPSLMWERFSAKDPATGNRRLFQGSGRGLGGGGSVNAMVYTRGAKLDYDEWPEGWRWSDIVPSFEAIEERLRPRRRPPTGFTEAGIEAAVEAGFQRKDDLNDGDLSGVLGYEWMNYEDNDRRSSYVAYLRPALSRGNLVVRTGADVHRLTFEASGRVSGVEYRHAGALESVSADHEVVLCAGAIATPRLLMLSGVGPGDELRRHGVPVKHDIPGVGQNLHDHPNVTIFFRSRRDIDCNYPQVYGFHRANPRSALPAGQSDSCYVLYPARSSLREGMLRLLPTLVLPDSLHDISLIPAAMRGGIDLAFRSQTVRSAVDRIYGVVVILGKPESRGRISLTSRAVSAPPHIDPGYFRAPEDMETMLRGVALARSITKGAPLREFGNQELFPGLLGRTRPALESWIRQNVMTTFHHAGTCRMGDDQGSVVDGRLRVRGIPGLRIADSSTIPVTPVSALNAPSMLVGHRGASFIREERSAQQTSSSAAKDARC